MPKETFHNLDAVKRERFIQEALKEFCLHDYQQASLSQIVKRLSIAKGSVYQYFENKADLYLYLYQLVQQKKAEYVQGRPMRPDEDFFDWIEELWVEGLRFDAENPLFTGFLFNVMYEKDEVAKHLMEENQARAKAYFGPLFRQFQESGLLRKDVDVDFMVHFFTQSAEGLARYTMRFHEHDIRERVKEGRPFISSNREEIMGLVKQLTRLLRTGMMDS